MQKKLTGAQIAACFLGMLCLLWLLLHTSKGSNYWILTYQTTKDGTPIIEVYQTATPNTRATIKIAEPNKIKLPYTRIVIDGKNQTLPLGDITFQDITDTPGRITLQFLKNKIDIMPGRLTVNGRDVPWEENKNTEIHVDYQEN